MSLSSVSSSCLTLCLSLVVHFTFLFFLICPAGCLSPSCLSCCLTVCLMSCNLCHYFCHSCSLTLTLCLNECPSPSPLAFVSLSLSCIHTVSQSLFLCHVLSLLFLLIITRPPLCTLLIGTILILTVFICLVIKRFIKSRKMNYIHF